MRAFIDISLYGLHTEDFIASLRNNDIPMTYIKKNDILCKIYFFYSSVHLNFVLLCARFRYSVKRWNV